jgi:hypothetical protein
MTKLDLSQFKPIPGFSCVQMKRDIQAKIYEETKHMTPEERRERTRRASESFREECQRFQDNAKGGENTER